MAQTAMTFTMKGDELHPMTLCHDTYGMDIYVPMNAPPIGQGSYGAVYKSYKLIQGRFKPCVVKAIPLHLGDRNPIEMEFQTLCSVSGIAGAGKIMQGPVYSLTHGFVVTE